MKTERLTLLVTVDEKAEIGRRAATLGISASEFVRKAAAMLDADDIAALEDIRSLVPELNAALESMQSNLSAALVGARETERQMAWLRSDEYRAQVRQEVADDASLDWTSLSAWFGGAADVAGAEARPARESGTLFERMSNIARNASAKAAPGRDGDTALAQPRRSAEKRKAG